MILLNRSAKVLPLSNILKEALPRIKQSKQNESFFFKTMLFHNSA